MKTLIFCLVIIFSTQGVWGQRKLPPKSREQKAIEKKTKRKEQKNEQPGTELRWDMRNIPSKSKGLPEISAWHTGTAGIIPSNMAEISLFNPSRIGFSKKTELLFRIAEEPFLPNLGLKHAWWENKRFRLSSGHTLYYTYPGLKILKKTGFKNLIPDSVKINQGIAMRHEILFSWLINPREWGCPDPPPEKIFTFQAGTEFYAGFGRAKTPSFDYLHSLYHTRLLEGEVLYYGGLQFDSYFGTRFHYSLNGLFYSVNLQNEYAVETNGRLTCYISRHVGISASCKLAKINVNETTKLACLPLLDLTYLVNPGRTTIKHGLFKKKRRHQ